MAYSILLAPPAERQLRSFYQGVMSPIEGCTTQDYAVLIVIGVGMED